MFYRGLEGKIAELLPGIVVVNNTIPADYKVKLLIGAAPIVIGQHSFPRLGAFEVYFNGHIVFSKLQTRRWPDLDEVVKRICRIQKGPKKSGARKTRSKMRFKVNFFPRGMPTTMRSSVDQNKLAKNHSSKLQKNSSSLMSGTAKLLGKKPKVKLVIQKSSVQVVPSFPALTKSLAISQQVNVNVNPVFLDKSQKALEVPSSQQMGSASELEEAEKLSSSSSDSQHIRRDVTKTFKLALPVNREVNKKITYFNVVGKDMMFTVRSSDWKQVVVNEEVFIQEGKKGKISITFNPCSHPCEKVFYVDIQPQEQGSEFFDCYELKVEFS